MSCVHPLKGWKIGVNPSGKPKYKITGYDVQYVGLRNGIWKEFYTPGCPAERYVFEYTEIPCGHCIGCRLDYSRTWADRICMEMTLHDADTCWFVTLTYDDDHLPISYYPDPATGEAIPVGTLDKRDPTLFLKRLRKNSGEKIRYYLAGEYGSETFRPHYHICLFGLHLDDLVFYKKSKLGDNYYNSPFLSQIWGKGHVVIAPLQWQSAAYTARYTAKKAFNVGREFYDAFHILPEYCVMSRRPGIASDFYDSHGLKDSYVLPSENGKAHVVRPPAYFIDKFELTNPEDYDKLKESRKALAMAHKKAIMHNTTLSETEYLARKEELMITAYKKLVRKDV